MIATLMTFCARCRAQREIRDWRQHGDSMFIELEGCGHIVRRCSRDEWWLDDRAAV